MNLRCNNQLNMAAILNQHPRSAGEKVRGMERKFGLGDWGKVEGGLLGESLGFLVTLRSWSHAHFANNNNNTDNNSSDDDDDDDNFFAEMTMDSVIIAENGFYLCHLKQFLTPAVGNISHWKICYRASKHGRYDFIFHQRCNGKNNTLTIIKKDEYVFGGFTDISWGNKFTFCY